MKTIFIPAKVKLKIDKSKIIELSKKLPENLAIAYSIQYQNQASEIKEIISKTHNVTKFMQVLGCSKPNFPINTKGVLLIGSGKFHAISLAHETQLPIYIYECEELVQISEKDIKLFEKNKRSAYLKFLNANKIGILISLKPGQLKLNRAIIFRKKVNKKAYLFLTDKIDYNEFDNFSIDSWVNTSCPRLDFDNSAIINLSDLNLGN